jgi:hypothetical protein
MIGRQLCEFSRLVQAALAELACLGGTFAPFFRASESPMAIACFRLFTLPPLPRLPEPSVPLFFLRIALATLLLAAFPYFRPRDLTELFLFAGMFPPVL